MSIMYAELLVVNLLNSRQSRKAALGLEIAAMHLPP